MRILTRTGWIEGFLDAHLSPGYSRIEVLRFRNLAPISGMFFVRKPSAKYVWNYVREIGISAVLAKIRSRAGESLRNKKYISVGIGRVMHSANHSLHPGALAAFLLPAGPACVERVVIPNALAMEWDDESLANANELSYLPLVGSACKPPDWCAEAAGWDAESGIPMPISREILTRDLPRELSVDWGSSRKLGLSRASEVAEMRLGRGGSRGRLPKATLLGYGNYAKTIVLPSVRRELDVGRVHEIDPTQIPANDRRYDWDTAPRPRDGDISDAILVAGYHHTHAAIAAWALRRNRYAVVEKPIVTTSEQLNELVDAVRNTPKLFACFHKRYLKFNRWAQEDLQLSVGDPVSMHAIVFEVPLPDRHWYRWPSSRSRVVSNGCHWLDHFLFLNEFSPPVSWEVSSCTHGVVNCTVELRNQAVLTLVLTDRGADRIGVQDNVELRTTGRTVRILNGAHYAAESSGGLGRTGTVNRLDSYRRMYREIARRIRHGMPGDPLESVTESAKLMLSLDREVMEEPSSVA